MVSSTISSNTGDFQGSAVYHRFNSSNSSQITQSTIVNNVRSAALFWVGAPNGRTFEFQANNVIANTALGNGSTYNTQTISFGTPNWLDDNSCGTVNSGDPRLGELADNGGPKQTHAPMPGSGLQDSGSLTTCDSDRVGFARPSRENHDASRPCW